MSNSNQIYIQAGRFNNAAVKLYQECEEDPTFIIPATVNGVLAIELYLKCILQIESKYDKIHKIDDLYLALSDNSKLSIQKRFNHLITNISTARFNQKNLFEKQIDRAVSNTVEDIVNNLSKVFVNWRYAFEGLNNCEFFYIDEFKNALVSRIEEIKNW